MAFDPELVAETREWFAKAFNDLRAAEALTATTPPLFDEAVFHCQQAAEKALKGFLACNGCAFRKTHNFRRAPVNRQRAGPPVTKSLSPVPPAPSMPCRPAARWASTARVR
ncbi:MAG: HEPN domain-containing protein [Bryobacteraceae bacterium]|jgi:hypothetical protein